MSFISTAPGGILIVQYYLSHTLFLITSIALFLLTDGKEVKKETKLGLSTKKEEDFPNWYSELVVSSELISYYDVSGCYILRPWAFSMWEVVQRWFDDNIKKLGVQNAYFPMFITEDVLNTEKDHVEGFAPEVSPHVLEV